MADDDNGGNLRRKRRRIRQNHSDKVDEIEQEGFENISQPLEPTYDFLNLASIIVERDIPILFPGKARPKNTYSLLQSGGSFLVFKEPRSIDDVILSRPEELWSPASNMVLKRTRTQHPNLTSHLYYDSVRYTAIMAELQVLTNHSIRMHENFIDLLGLTWDYEPNADDSESVWPVLALEEAECTLESLLRDIRESPFTSKLKYCYDIAKALHFLHQCNVTHCDVKAENVLICVTSYSGTIAKLSDFGSAILDVTPETCLEHGVAGSPPWNAPEWNKKLVGLDILKVDVFSFAMLVWRSVAMTGILDEIQDEEHTERMARVSKIEAKKQSGELLETAYAEVRASGRSEEPYVLDEVFELLRNTLIHDPRPRWDFDKVEDLLRQCKFPLLAGGDALKEDSLHDSAVGNAADATEASDESPDTESSQTYSKAIKCNSLMPFSDDVSIFQQVTFSFSSNP